MQIYRVDHHGAAQARGVVIVIDVIRAFLATDQFRFAMVGTHKQWNNIHYVDVHKVDVPSANF
jgi:hypothetical protein